MISLSKEVPVDTAMFPAMFTAYDIDDRLRNGPEEFYGLATKESLCAVEEKRVESTKEISAGLQELKQLTRELFEGVRDMIIERTERVVQLERRIELLEAALASDKKTGCVTRRRKPKSKVK
jgi:BMFP domain-containing protein YqiC